jgi:hypothetical protein
MTCVLTLTALYLHNIQMHMNQVNYVGKGGRLFQEGERVPGAFTVVSRYVLALV